ncbi:MAG: proteasome subunit beta [Candidatus Woesearchaeota archaeon]
MDNLKTGTTTLGLVCKDCIVLAADCRVTAGNLIVDSEFEKVFPVSESMAVTVAGSVSTVQMLVQYLKSELSMLKIRNNRKPTTHEAVNLLRNWVYSVIRQPTMIPGIAHFLFAGCDSYGVHLYDVAPDGSLNKDNKFKTTGSGSTFVYGVLENKYKEHMTEEEGIKLAIECVDAAIQRDNASGNGINVYVINKDGVKKAATKKVNTHLN